jgi:hypothetical protein
MIHAFMMRKLLQENGARAPFQQELRRALAAFSKQESLEKRRAKGST